jgi:hypothetical protein
LIRSPVFKDLFRSSTRLQLLAASSWRDLDLRRVDTMRPGQAIQVLRRSAGAKAILVRRWASVVVPPRIEKIARVLEGNSPNEFNTSANPYAPTPSHPVSLACHLIHGLALGRSQCVPRSYLVPPALWNLYPACGTCSDMTAPLYPMWAGSGDRCSISGPDRWIDVYPYQPAWCQNDGVRRSILI